MHPHNTITWKPAAALVFNAFVWGVSWWPLRQLQGHGLHPLWSTTLVFAFILLGITLLRPQTIRHFVMHPGLWGLVIAAGCTNVGFNWGVTVGNVVRVVLLFYLMPAWTVLLAWMLLNERPTRSALLRLVMALMGVLLVLKSPQSAWPVPQNLADYLGLVGGFFFAATNVLLNKLRHTPDDARAWAMFAGGTLMPGTTALLGMQWGVVSAPLLPLPTWPMAFGLCLAFWMSNRALQYGAARLPANTTSLIMLTEVLFASVSAIALNAAHWDLRTLIGGSLIVCAAAHAAWNTSTKRLHKKQAGKMPISSHLL